MQPDNPVFASRVSSGDSRPFLPLTGHSVFWPGALLALALLIYKAALLTTINGWSIGLILLHPLFLQMPAYQDLAFAFTVTASFGIAMAASYRWPSVRRGLWWVFLSFCTACVLFAVICFPIFKYLHVPLTLGLLHATGSLSGAATSVAGYVSPWEIAAVVILPLVYLVLSLILATYLPSTSTGRSMAVYIALAGLVLGLWLVGSRRISTDKWAFNGSQAIAMNPQWVMLDSLYHDLIAPNAIAQKSDFPQEYLADFSLSTPHPPADPVAPAARRPKNLILIILESTAAQYLGVYGSPYDTTPQLNAERRHCLIFDNCYAQVGQTALSLIAIVTSRYPSFRYAHSPMDDVNESSDSSAPRVLQEHGYRTGFVSAADLEFWDQNKFLPAEGFDDLIDPRNLGCPMLFSWGVRDSCMMDALIYWVQMEPGRPFFTVGWTIQTHAPYATTPGEKVIDFLPPDGSEDTAAKNRYLNALREADNQLGRLFAALRELHLDQDTAVLITGDHGEAFGGIHDSHFHGLNLYEEDIHVPMILWSPALFSQETHSSVVGGHVDIGPTILDLLGINSPAGQQGKSLFRPDPNQRVYFFQNKSYLLFGLRSGRWKYIYNSVTAKEQLFDLQRDPGETTNLAASSPSQCLEFHRRIMAWIYCQIHR
jgi:lipoteichoic acid synthase